MKTDHEDQWAAEQIATMSSGVPCTYCKRETVAGDRWLHVTLDHVWPRGMRQIPEQGLKVICCRQCNQIKGSLTPSQWLRFMRQNPRWWLSGSFKPAKLRMKKW